MSTKALVVNLPKQMHRDFSIKCTSIDKTMGEVVRHFIGSWLGYGSWSVKKGVYEFV